MGLHSSRSTWRGGGPSKSFISRVIIGVTPFGVLFTVLITYLLSPLPLQAGCLIQGSAIKAPPLCPTLTEPQELVCLEDHGT